MKQTGRLSAREAPGWSSLRSQLPALTAPATISHGHGPEDGSPPRFEREEGTAALADLLSPGHPRNADGTVRPDGTAPPLS